MISLPRVLVSLLVAGWFFGPSAGWAGDEENRQRRGELCIAFQSLPLNLLSGTSEAFEAEVFSGLVWDPLSTRDNVDVAIAAVVDPNYQALDKQGNRYLFQIKPNAKWSDGSEVVALDVLSSYRLWLNKSLMSGPYMYATTQIAGISPSQDKPKAFILDLKVSTDNPLYALDLPLYKASQVVKMNDNYTLSLIREQSINPSNGPFMYEFPYKGQMKNIKLTRNDYYYRPTPPKDGGIYPVTELTLRHYNTAITAMQDVLNGSCDMFLNWPQNNTVPNNLGKRDISVQTITGIIVNMNREKGNQFLRDEVDIVKKDRNRKIRKALDMLIDRPKILSMLIGRQPTGADFNLLLHGPMPKKEYQNMTPPELAAHDPAGAGQELTRLGLRKDSKGKWTDSSGNLLKLRFIHGDFGRDAEKHVCDEIIKTLEDNGFEVQQLARSSDELNARLKSGEFDLAFKTYTLSGTHRENLEFLFCPNDSYNLGCYDSHEVSKKVSQAKSTINPDNKLAIQFEASSLIADDRPWLFLYDLPYQVVYRPSFLRLPANDAGLSANDLFINVCDWRTGSK